MLVIALDLYEINQYKLYQKSLGIIGLINAFCLQFVYPIILRKTDFIFRISSRLLFVIALSSIIWYSTCYLYLNSSFFQTIFFSIGHLIFTLGSLYLYVEFVNLMRLRKDEIIHIFPVVISLAQVFSLAISVLIIEDFLYYYWFSGIFIIVVYSMISRLTVTQTKGTIDIRLDSVKCTFVNLYLFFFTPFSFHLIFNDIDILLRNQFYLSERVFLSGSSLLVAPLMVYILRGKIEVKQKRYFQKILAVLVVLTFVLLRYWVDEFYVMWFLWIPLVIVHVYNGLLSRAMIAANLYQKKTLILEIAGILLLVYIVYILNVNFHFWYYGLTALHLLQIQGKHRLLGESSV